jgi:hypothetical protein
MYFAQMADAELPDHLPESWLEQVEFQLRGEVPVTFSEEPLAPSGHDTETAGVIDLVRRTLFPSLGLDP